MKLLSLLLASFTLFAVVLGWTKEDYEVFDLVSAIESAEGKGTTFYSWLDIPSSATSSEISKAYRKKSMTLHPDKNPGVKGIQERFARLGVVAAILRDSEGRKRYDFFYKNGVPKWRGTGYYYSRYRPGLGSVVVFLVFITSLLQFIVQKFNYTKDVERVARLVEKAKAAAWGSKTTPQEGSRKVKVPLSERDDTRWIDVLVEGNEVFLLGEDEPEPLNVSVVEKPAFFKTWAFSMIGSLVSKVLPKSQPKVHDEDESAEEETDAGETTDGASTPGGTSTRVKGTPSATAKAGGSRRRKVPSKRTNK